MYNGIISGMSVDGKSFFYVNPLEVLPEASAKDQRREHVKPERQKWFNCSCCPPNLARILTSLGAYAYSKRGDTFYMHLFVGGTINTPLDSGVLGLEVATDYPWDGNISITVTKSTPQAELAVHLTGWCESHSLFVNDKPTEGEIRDGYLCLTGFNVVKEFCKIGNVRYVAGSQSASTCRYRQGCHPVWPDSLLYGRSRQADTDADLHRVFLKKDARFSCAYDESFMGGAVLLESPGLRLDHGSWDPDTLYRKSQPAQYEEVSLNWVPYYLWANQGAGEMCCWVHTV